LKNNPDLLADQELLAMIKMEFEEIQPTGCHDFFKKRSKTPSLPYLKKRFHATWNDILLMAGVPEENLNFVRRSLKTKDYYLRVLRDLADTLGRTPTWNEYVATGESSDRLKNYFGSYNQAVREAGLSPHLKSVAKKPASHQQLKLAYLKLSQRLGKPATISEIERDCKEFSVTMFLKEFGGIRQLRRELGMPGGNQGSEPYYTKKELVKKLIAAYQRKQVRLTAREIQRDPTLPSYMAIVTRFQVHSLADVWNEIEVMMANEYRPVNLIS
jgi:hypothetical protein